MKSGFFVGLVVGLVLFNLNVAKAGLIVLTITPKGTNQAEFRFGPVVPGVSYEILARTNAPDGHWMTFAGIFFGSSNKIETVTATLDRDGELKGLTLETLKNWTFVAGPWDDDLGDEFPRLYKDLVLRCDPFAPVDPYASPAGDGWTIYQKMMKNWDQLGSYEPPQPRTPVKFFATTTNLQSHIGKAIVTIQNVGGVFPDYIDIEKATRTLRPPDTNADYPGPFRGPGYPGPMGNRYPISLTNRLAAISNNFVTMSNRFVFQFSKQFFARSNLYVASASNRFSAQFSTNIAAMSNRFAAEMSNGLARLVAARSNQIAEAMSNRFARPTANRPPYPRPRYGRPMVGPPPDPWITGPYQPLARIRTRAGVQEYTYTDTNVDTLAQPLYQISAHFVPPFSARFDRVDADSIRRTMVAVKAQPGTNGYDLTTMPPAPYACYLLLVRDRNDHQWRASGYFESGTNSAPISLHVDSKGMMKSALAFPAMPEMKFLPDVVDPEFIAGSGQDSDGDGLPDVYEVLVTHTDPDKADTGNTGVLDGYKEFTDDGWSNLEKFRRRADPFKAAQAPAPVVLTQPTMEEAMLAMAPTTEKSDLKYEPQIQVRMVGTSSFQTVRQGWQMLYQMSDPRNSYRVRGNFDLRISWVVPQPRPRRNDGYHGP